jgi:hypothetical protein
MKRTNFYFPEGLIERIRLAAKKEGRSMSEFIRRAIVAALEKLKL